MKDVVIMKLKNSYFNTLREEVKDEESKSGNLLVRSGMIKKTSAGIYMFLPLGYKVLENIKKLIEEEMNAAGAQELLMPLLINEEYFIKSGRNNSFGGEMFSLSDRVGKKYALGPTHEELFTVAACLNVKSYKDLPFNLYQIGTKFRDEKRPRYGLIRVREFLMKDAYSFDKDEEQNNISYQKMFDAYKKIFDRCELDYVICEADTGAMGGQLSEEFQALADIGEDVIVSCECGYAKNLEVATNYIEKEEKNIVLLSKEKIFTPNVKTINEVCEFLNINVNNAVKTLIYKTEDELIMLLLNGEDELNIDKLEKFLGKEVEAAIENEIFEALGSKPGFLGPINANIKIIADEKIKYMKNFCVGANIENYHFINVNLSDFKVNAFTDLREVKQGDLCPKCKRNLNFNKGIEIGNTFKLGTKYSEAFGLTYLDENNLRKPVVMGCYGIGLGRILAAIAEQKSDEYGLVWPTILAPFKVAIVIANIKDETQVELASELYNVLKENKIDVLLDDRDERAGVKFKDMDLIGIPFRITVGKKANENIVEFKSRTSKEIEFIDYKDILSMLKSRL